MLAHPPGEPANKYVVAELAELKHAMPEGERMLPVAELEALMKDAEAGALDFATAKDGRRVGDVDQMMAAPTVLEIRFETTTGTQGGDRKIRLYFTEPVELPEKLVALLLGNEVSG